MDIILIHGLWLDASAWDSVAEELRRLGHQPHAVRLPGAGDDDANATLDMQLDAVLATIDASTSPLVVGHSAASTLAWLAADRRADVLHGVALVGGFPSGDGAVYADFFPVVDAVMAFPGWEPFEGPDAADLASAQREALEASAHPVPGGVAGAVVEYRDDARHGVPVTLICPEYSPDDLRAWIAGGDIPELAAATDVTYLDIDSGHWPMVSRPVELAALLAGIAEGRRGEA